MSSSTVRKPLQAKSNHPDFGIMPPPGEQNAKLCGGRNGTGQVRAHPPGTQVRWRLIRSDIRTCVGGRCAPAKPQPVNLGNNLP
jgi:hypothetical protein